MIRLAAVFLMALAAPVAAQGTVITSPIDGSTVIIPDVKAEEIKAQAQVSGGPRAV